MHRGLWSLLAAATVLVMTGQGRAAEGTAVDPQRARVAEGDETRWYDIRELPVEGRGWSETRSFYDRLPAKAEGVVRDPVWSLSQHSAGMRVRFVTDATAIQAHWKLRGGSLALPHMPATGVSGLDLYARDDQGRWRWVANGRPTQFPDNQQLLAGSLDGAAREYCLYLPLYNGVETVELGLPAQATLRQPPDYPAGVRPVVFYGTSITQGGCASRPGMTYAAILGRWLDLPTINLGFSGNGKMEPEMAQLLAELDPSVYVLNCLPNMSPDEVTERIEPFVRALRAAHAETPIVLAEDRSYANASWQPALRERNASSRAALRGAYERLLQAGVTGLHYAPGDSQLGADGEDTVDGSHPTDLGFLRMAEAFRPVLAPLVGQGKE